MRSSDHQPIFRPRLHLPIGKAVLAALFLTGCGAPSLPGAGPGMSDWSTFLADGTRQQLPADWDDIAAAVMIGASQSEMAVLAANRGPTRTGDPGDQTERIFELKTVRDEPAWLRVTRSGHQDGPELLLEAKVGRYGDEKREKELLRHVSARLEALHGREVAPLRR